METNLMSQWLRVTHRPAMLCTTVVITITSLGDMRSLVYAWNAHGRILPLDLNRLTFSPSW